MKTRYEELTEQFKEFHIKHPMVWELYQQFAFDRIKMGFKNYSSKGIFERIRWEIATPNTDPKDFKLNNNYTAFYARWFMQKFPEHEGFFRLRDQQSYWLPATNRPRLGPGDYPEQKSL